MNTYLNAVITGMGVGTGLAIISVILHSVFHVGFCG